jgi:hypothetical protein
MPTVNYARENDVAANIASEIVAGKVVANEKNLRLCWRPVQAI